MDDRLAVIFAALPSIVVLASEEGTIRHVNHLPPKVLERVVGRSLFEFLPEDQVPTVRRALERALATGEAVSYEVCLHKNLRQTGPLAWYVTDLAPFEVDGEQRGVILVSREITAEREARLAYKRLAEAVECTSDSVIVMDPDGRIRYTNPAFTRITGYGPEEAAGRTPSFLATDRSHALEGILRTVAERGEPWCGECTWRSRDGSTLVVTGSVSPVHDGDGTLSSLVCVQRDITETRHLERSLNTARKLEAVGRLAAGIAYEINTPAQYARDNTVFIEEALPPILALLEAQAAVVEAARSAGVAETLLEAVKEAEEAAQLDFVAAELPSAIASVKEGLDRIARIVRAMKDFAHPSDGKMEACDLNAVAEASVTVAQNEWKHHAEVELDFQEDLPSVTCIRDEVGQVILNLIVNATHAIAETGERGRIRVRTRAEGECVELRVEDTGTGIPKAVRDKVFDPFFTTKEVGKGTGQGLALAHSVIVETHQGQIIFETEEGEGTTFIVRIPCQPPEARSDDARPLRG